MLVLDVIFILKPNKSSALQHIPEPVLLREIVYVFQGIAGKHITYSHSSDSFSVDAKVESKHGYRCVAVKSVSKS